MPEKVGSAGPCCPPLPTGRMDPFSDTLQRLREAFRSGRTRPAEFRAAQLKGLGRFLQDHKKLLQEALAQDLHKVKGRELAVSPVHPCLFNRPFPGRQCIQALYNIHSIKPGRRFQLLSHVTDGDTEAGGGCITCPRYHSQEVAELELKPRSPGPGPVLLSTHCSS